MFSFHLSLYKKLDVECTCLYGKDGDPCIKCLSSLASLSTIL